MIYLLNSSGEHIANEINGKLYNLSGKHIGNFVKDYWVFKDLDGNYLGEVIYENRLVYNPNATCESLDYERFTNYSKVISFLHQQVEGATSLPEPFKDVEMEKYK